MVEEDCDGNDLEVPNGLPAELRKLRTSDIVSGVWASSLSSYNRSWVLEGGCNRPICTTLYNVEAIINCAGSEKIVISAEVHEGTSIHGTLCIEVIPLVNIPEKPTF